MLTQKIIDTTKQVIKEVSNEYPETFNPEMAKSKYPDIKGKWDLDVTRRLAIPIICERANKRIGKDIWALLYRNDRQDTDPRPGRLTSDVLVFRETKEHFDVLSGKGPMWEAHGPITDKDWDLEEPSLHKTWEDLKGSKPDVPPIEPKPDESEQIKKLKEIIDLQAKEIEELKKNKPIPVAYSQFVDNEALDIRRAFNEKRNADPTCHDYYHNAYRRLVEDWSHENIIKDI